jgi:hypothetical protein
MIYIACDMNCNNHGNFFSIIGHEREVNIDDTGYYFNKTHYPKSHCYRCKPPHPIGETFRYSEAMDILHPNEFVRWVKTRFGFSEFISRVLNELKFRTDNKDNRFLSLMDLRALIEMIEEEASNEK